MEEKVDKYELIRRWRKNWLNILFDLTHIEIQKKIWIDAIFTDRIGCYGEDMCMYFDDLFLENDYKDQIEYGDISVEEYNIIKEFHELLSKYDEKGKLDSEILKDPDWINLTRIGLQSWNNLKNVINETDEINFINELETKYLTKNAS